ncbi:sensor domain-containing diguanylate cyclase [Pararobbsia silviterrae]|uniref:sensor domain-containing diguanylate cyclase n=1 Tax=Pararobbsia silviterrae TaxID=1792498 RepID=UPI001314D28C|nr:sensor domain-containing diguanylate cyclase [Pararobbsia silviterrae]
MRRSLVRLAGLLAAGALIVSSWWVADDLANRLARNELGATAEARVQIASAVAESVAQSLDGDLALLRGIPTTVAATPFIRDTLVPNSALSLAAMRTLSEDARRESLESNPQLAPLNAFLQRVSDLADIDAVWVVTRDGLCIAASNAKTVTSFVGDDVADRPYMGAIATGTTTIGFARGHTTGRPGIYVTAPVILNNTVIGAIVGKLNTSRARHWVAQPGAFIADQNGVIVLAQDPSLELYALPGASVLTMSREMRAITYAQQIFPTLTVSSEGARVHALAPWLPAEIANELVSIENGPPSLLEVRKAEHAGLSAGLIAPLDVWDDARATFRRNRFLIFLAVLSVMTVGIVLALSYYRERHLHHNTRDMADQLKQANARLSDEARYDSLTGALSRRYFLDLLSTQMRASQLSRAPLTVAIADLDHFKQINDRCGHATGDRALEYFLSVCERVLRVGDSVGRLGGEEFGILMPGAPPGQAERVAEAIRIEFRRARPKSIPDDVGLSVSLGIATAIRNDTPERLLSRADQALYLAKARGRNRSVVFDTQTGADSRANAAESRAAENRPSETRMSDTRTSESHTPESHTPETRATV